jgi:hypothetical protein
MNGLLDAALVAIVLAASVGYALYSLGPKTLRRWFRTALADLAARVPAALHLGGIERRLRGSAGGSGACGGCDSCAPSGADARGAGADPRDAAMDARGGGKDPRDAGIEIRVPAASIGRRVN